MFTSQRTSILTLLIATIFGAYASSAQADPLGTARAEIRDPATGQVYFTIFELPDDSVRLWSPSMVLTPIGSLSETGLPFTAYYHNGQNDPVFWTRKYAGNFVFLTLDPSGTASGTFSFTFEYIGDVADPIENPQPVEFVMVSIE